ncbi:hypothetical protein DH2020_042867 [Rehmannia glutinosa]|uniref:Uncharacterized protein n=1 Tax=Rehmannia glutinosa TaxID=99300 RepID=A0ABR0UM69_REHGL
MDDSYLIRTQTPIDRLSDDLLISILSRFSMTEAARTSVLARRWRYFWTNNRVLDFDAVRVLSQIEERDTTLHNERIRFVKWVNKVAMLHSYSTIDEFRISFDLDEGFDDHLDRWIQFAFRKRVKKLELNLVKSHHTHTQHKQYSFPNMSHGVSSIESLVTLILTNVDVTEEVLIFFVSNCPFLEELCVKGSNCLENLRTSRPAIRLRRLEIVDCRGFRSLKICSPNLISYTFHGTNIPMVLKNVASLVSLSLGAKFHGELILNMNKISRCLSQLETLTLRVSEFQGRGVILPIYPHLPRLKKLVIDICTIGFETSLLGFTRLINAAPSLREILLKITCSQPLFLATIPHYQGPMHQSLEVLQIEGFAGAKVDLELALYIVEHAVSLKKVVIDFRRPTGGEQCVEMEMEMARKGILLLEAKLPEGAELIIHE